MIVIGLISWSIIILGFAPIRDAIETSQALEQDDTKRAVASKIPRVLIEKYACGAQNPESKELLWIVLVGK